MGTAYIQTTITAEEGDVILFEAEAVAEVEYVIEDGDLTGWHVSDLRFDHHASTYDATAGRWVYKVDRSAWCPEQLLAVLVPYIDKAKLEDELFEHLTEAGEVRLETSAGQLAHYHAAVM